MVADTCLSAAWFLACLAPVFDYLKMELADAIASASLAELGLVVRSPSAYVATKN